MALLLCAAWKLQLLWRPVGTDDKMDIIILHGPVTSFLVWCRKDSLVLVYLEMDIRMLRARVCFRGKTEKT